MSTREKPVNAVEAALDRHGAELAHVGIFDFSTMFRERRLRRADVLATLDSAVFGNVVSKWDTAESIVETAGGLAVGMPSDDDMGNSEVGHNAMGCGRVFEQGARLVDQAIASGAIWDRPAWREVCAGATLHLIGLVSDGNVHSNTSHLSALIRRAAADGLTLAQPDSSPRSGHSPASGGHEGWLRCQIRNHPDSRRNARIKEIAAEANCQAGRERRRGDNRSSQGRGQRSVQEEALISPISPVDPGRTCGDQVRHSVAS